jgi:hypothetical protein
MPAEPDSELRMALRHVNTGRRCILRQADVIATLRGKDLPIEEAESVLHWLEETQRGFEDHYRKLLSDGFALIELANKALADPRGKREAGAAEEADRVLAHSSPNISDDK